MKILENVAAKLGIQQGEGLFVISLFLHSFLLGASAVFFLTAGSALFLAEVGTASLPYVYIGSAIATVLVGSAFRQLQVRVPFTRLLMVLLVFHVTFAVAFFAGLHLTQGKWIFFALLIWVRMVMVLISLEFWILAGRLFNLRQAKRLFGLAGSGFVVSRMLGYAAVPVIVYFTGTENLVGLGATTLGLALITLTATLRRGAQMLTAEENRSASTNRREKEQRAQNVDRGLLRNRYILLILAAAFVSTLVSNFVDYGFSAATRDHFPDAGQLAQFFGLFYAVVYSFSFIFMTGATPKILSRYGIQVGLLVLPVLLATSTISVAIVGSFGGQIGLVFWLVISMKFVAEGLDSAIMQPSVSLCYQPLQRNQRAAAQSTTESFVKPVAKVLVGLILLLLNASGGISPVFLAYIVIGLLVLWIAANLYIQRGYVANLTQALARRLLEGGTLELNDPAAVAVIQAKLNSPHPGEAIYALDLLESARPDALPSALRGLLLHPEGVVQREAALRIERLRLVAALPDLEQAVEQCRHAGARGAIFQAISALGTEADIVRVGAALLRQQHDDSLMRLGTMVGILHNPDLAHQRPVHNFLTEMVTSPDPYDRSQAAQVLGKANGAGLDDLWPSLLRDPDRSVRQAALLAAGEAKNPQNWPAVVEALRQPRDWGYAFSALVAGGESILPTVQSIFATEETQVASIPLLVRLTQVCGRVRGEKVIALFKDKLDHPNPDVRSEILRTLNRSGYQAGKAETAMVLAQLRSEVQYAVMILAALVDLGEHETLGLLLTALQSSLSQCLDRIFYLLSFSKIGADPGAVMRARETLKLASAEKQAYALELIEMLVPPDMRGQIMPLFSTLPLEQRLRLEEKYYRPALLGRSGRLLALISAEDEAVNPWGRSCALFAAGLVEIKPGIEWASAMEKCLSHPDSLVRETARQSFARLSPPRDLSQPVVDALPADSGEPYHGNPAGGDRRSVPGEQTPDLSTIERVLLLKRVSIFASTPDPILAELAPLLETISFAAGEQIFAKGDAGNSMYIVLQGEVRVHDGATTLNHLAPWEVFGEMALLDPQPRMASVTALQDTQLYELDQEALYTLMNDRIEVARGILQVLTRRLRDRVQDLQSLRQQHEEAV